MQIFPNVVVQILEELKEVREIKTKVREQTSLDELDTFIAKEIDKDYNFFPAYEAALRKLELTKSQISGKLTLMYSLLYYLAYKFSGAHQKPTSDSKYDPKLDKTDSKTYTSTQDDVNKTR